MLKKIKLSLFVVLILSVTACGSSVMRESTGEFIDSAAVTTKVKAKLVDSLGTQAFAIKVKTYKESVQLSGFVDSNLLKKQAGIIAGNITGVSKVKNDIIVKSRT
ncbi:MAG: BON domain-containing protein [Legionellaceae bacterium]|nr:BON domain-containing protein [Legionellaceae bacterium]